MQAFKRRERVCSLPESNDACVRPCNGDVISENMGQDKCNNEVLGLDNPSFISNEMAN